MTERLYETDSYCREFSAKVLSCNEVDGFFNIILDRTAFFPEGGGQAADKGSLEDVEVLDVQIENGIVFHKTEKPFSEGSTVKGCIDWDLRFQRMQSHSGEHIVSGIIHSIFGYSNVGFHMSEASMTVDLSGPLTPEDIARVELEANRAVYKNMPITAIYPSVEELEKISYRSKIDISEGTRIVTIGDVDCCACCAPHVANTGEIGLIKILDFAPHRGGTRIEMIAGINAYNDYLAISNSNKALMKMFSASRYDVADAAVKQSELLQNLKSENMKMSRELALFRINPEKIGNIELSITESLSYDDLRYCANSYIENGSGICVFLSKAGDGNYLYVVSSKESDIRGLVKSINEEFNGKGGGKPDYAQGRISGCDKDALIRFLADF